MKARMHTVRNLLVVFSVAATLLVFGAKAQNANFHGAPESAKQLKNPYESQPAAAGKPLYHLRCARAVTAKMGRAQATSRLWRKKK